MEDQISFFAALAAGFLSFISPCVLPLIPAYISYISGISLEELKNSQTLSKEAKRRILLNSLLFVLGFTIVFVSLGASATGIGAFLVEHRQLTMRIAGVIIIILGIHTTGWLKLPFLMYEKRIQVNPRAATSISILLMGMAFAFGWTPCIGPLLGGILLMASGEETLLKGMLLLATYSFGLGLPFVLTGLAVNRFFSAMSRIKRHFRLIEIISGLLLVIIGIMIFAGTLGYLSGLLYQVFPFLQNF